ncbi:hypothetical protein GCM10020220_053860 [Nonomuraea rubra]
MGGRVEKAEQGEQMDGVLAGGLLLEVLEADGDAGSDGQVGMLQRVQAAGGVGEPVGEIGQCPVGAGGQTRRRDAQGEGQATAEPDDPPGSLGLGVDPAGAGDPGQQRGGFGRVEFGQVQLARPVDRGENLPARDDDRAPRPGGNERAELAGVQGVVEDEQHVPRRSE